VYAGAVVGYAVIFDNLTRDLDWAILRWATIQAESYSAVMATVSQAAAAMLALFFTAISVVASTSYAKVTTDTRSLVAHDDLNRRYLRLLAHTATVALAGLGLQALGYPPSALLASYVLVIAAVGLLAFFPIGVRTFALFDHSILTNYPVRTFARALQSVTRHGRRWSDQLFENHANRIAEAQLRILADLVVFGIKEDRPRQKVLLDIANAIQCLARFYAAIKLSVPSNSLWFTKRAEFKRWEVSSSSMTELTMQTGVAPQPEAVPDYSFVEARCTDMTIQCLRHFFAHDAIDEAVNLLLGVNQTATAYARMFGQTDAIHLVAATRTLLIDRLKGVDPGTEPLKHLQLVDVQCVAALAPVLDSARSLTEGPVEKLVLHDLHLLRLNRRKLYATQHPRGVLNELDELFSRLEFESSVEGVIKTQPWFVRQIISSGYAAHIRQVILGIVSTIEAEFLSPASELIEAQRPMLAAAWLQRGIEACHKAEDSIQSLNARYEELNNYHVTEAPWLPSGADDALARVAASRKRIVRSLATIVPALSSLTESTGLPDFLGQTRAWLAEEIVSMMERREQEGFPELFIAYFNASIAVMRQFLALAEQPERQDYVRVAMDTILEVMNVSGLALLFSELDSTPYGPIVSIAWDQFIEQSTNKSALLNGWYSAIDSTLSLPLFSPSAMRRQDWGRRLAQAMVDRGVDVEREAGPWRGQKHIQRHPSAVIDSIIVSYGRPMGNLYEYFGALYLARRAESKDIEVPYVVSNCMKRIERARERHEEGSNDAPTNE